MPKANVGDAFDDHQVSHSRQWDQLHVCGTIEMKRMGFDGLCAGLKFEEVKMCDMILHGINNVQSS